MMEGDAKCAGHVAAISEVEALGDICAPSMLEGPTISSQVAAPAWAENGKNN